MEEIFFKKKGLYAFKNYYYLQKITIIVCACMVIYECSKYGKAHM